MWIVTERSVSPFSMQPLMCDTEWQEKRQPNTSAFPHEGHKISLLWHVQNINQFATRNQYCDTSGVVSGCQPGKDSRVLTDRQTGGHRKLYLTIGCERGRHKTFPTPSPQCSSAQNRQTDKYLTHKNVRAWSVLLITFISTLEVAKR